MIMSHLTVINIRETGKAAVGTIRLSFFALALVSLAACTKGDVVGGNTKQMAIETPPAADGFLPRPELLAHNPGTLWDLTYLRPGLNPQAYNAIYLEPVEILIGPHSKLATLPADQREKLANTLYSDVYTAVRKSCHVARRPGPGVLQFHMALSDAVSSDGVTKTLASYVPYVNVAYKASSLAFNGGVGYFSGTATAEAYATDGATQELLWQGVDKRGGNSPLIQDTTDSWLDVNNAFKAWAAQLVTRLQSTGICPPVQAVHGKT
jgi:hypothetical protein